MSRQRRERNPLKARTSVRIAFIWCALSILVAACGVSEVPDKRRELMRSWGESFLLRQYDRLDARVQSLSERIDALCEAPSETRLSDARDAWWKSRAPWKRTEMFAFGPYTALPNKVGVQIDFWPARPGTVDEVLVSEEPIDPALLGAPGKGFTAVEYLLYEADVADFSSEEGQRRCEYLGVIATELKADVRTLHDAWDPRKGDYLRELIDAGRGSETYDTLPMALSEIVNRLAFTIENIRADKLGAVVGRTSGGSIQPGKMESPFSGRAIQDIADNLSGIETLYFGDEADGVLGLNGYLGYRGYHYDDEMRAELASSRDALDEIGDLRRAIEQRPEDVDAAIDDLGRLQRLIQVDLINALALSVRFNDNDGD